MLSLLVAKLAKSFGWSELAESLGDFRYRFEAVNLFVGCDKRSKLQGGVPARAIIEVRGRPPSSQISAPAHRERYSARLSHPTTA
jgi:hypothetical protein